MEEPNEIGLFWSPVSIKLDKDGLDEVRSPLLNFHLLVLEFHLILLQMVSTNNLESPRLFKGKL